MIESYSLLRGFTPKGQEVGRFWLMYIWGRAGWDGKLPEGVTSVDLPVSGRREAHR